MIQIHAIAYNIFNWFRQLELSANMRKQHIDNIHPRLLKLATKLI